MGSFEGKVAIVTGAASGIGRALSTLLVAGGARVVLADVNREMLGATVAELRREDETRAVGEFLDVRDAEAVKVLVEGAAKKHGRIDYVFNNAGIAIMGEAHDLPLSAYDRTIDVNLRGVIYVALAAYEVMRAQGFGHIVNTASIAGLVPSPGLAAYAATKHAVVGFSQTLRIEAEAFGVRVSAACPGVVDTPLVRKMELVNMDQEMLDRQIAEAPIRLYPVEACAADILRGVERNRALIMVTGHGKAIAVLYAWMPGLCQRVLVKQLAKSRARHEAARQLTR